MTLNKIIDKQVSLFRKKFGVFTGLLEDYRLHSPNKYLKQQEDFLRQAIRQAVEEALKLLSKEVK